MSTGTITRRGAKSWRIKFDLERDPVTGDRRTQYVTVHGTKKDAQTALNKKLAAVAEGEYVERSAVTVADYARHWVTAIAPSSSGEKTRERYREIIETQIVPQLGSVPLQKLDATRIDAFYAHLKTAGRRKVLKDGVTGLSSQTVRHIHRLLSQILKSAVIAKRLNHSPMIAVQTVPKVRREEVQVLEESQLITLYRHLKGRPLYMPVLLAANTGMRRGEVLALRWKDVDLDAGTLRVAQVVEQTKGKLALKEPKTDRSRRAIALSPRLVQELRRHKSEQATWRLRLGIGKDQQDLVFPSADGSLRNPRFFTKEFSREVVAAKMPDVTFHGLRHTHITHLLKAGVPVHVVSARAGHANPTVTLNIYAHQLSGQQEAAAAVMDQALRVALEE